MVQRSIESGEAYYFVAQRHSTPELIGMMLCQRTLPSWCGVSSVYVEDLYTREQYRHGMGVGTALLSQAAGLAMRFATEGGRPQEACLRLDADRALTGTVAFYRSRGMQDDNINFRLYGPDVSQLAGLAQ
jgi:ribosomal protein S18 acetylase RimI-like enzyme